MYCRIFIHLRIETVVRFSGPLAAAPPSQNSSLAPRSIQAPLYLIPQPAYYHNRRRIHRVVVTCEPYVHPFISPATSHSRRRHRSHHQCRNAAHDFNTEDAFAEVCGGGRGVLGRETNPSCGYGTPPLSTATLPLPLLPLLLDTYEYILHTGRAHRWGILYTGMRIRGGLLRSRQAKQAANVSRVVSVLLSRIVSAAGCWLGWPVA